MSALFPVFIDIKGKKCVVIGGGKVAERKIKTLLKYKARVIVISPEITEEIKKLVSSGKVNYIKKEYSKNDIKDALLVVAATSDTKINAQIVKDAKFLVNNVTKEALQLNSQGKHTKNIEYIVPAIFTKGDLTVAISTQFPSLSRVLRDEIKDVYGKDFAYFLKYLKKLRKDTKRKIKDSKIRQELFKKITSKKIVSNLKQYGFKKTKEEIDRIIDET